MDVHAAGGRNARLSDEQIEAVQTWRQSGRFDGRQQLVLELAEAMTGTPADVSDELFERLRGEFSEGQLVELAAEIAFENFRARFNRAFAVEPQGLYKWKGRG